MIQGYTSIQIMHNTTQTYMYVRTYTHYIEALCMHTFTYNVHVYCMLCVHLHLIGSINVITGFDERALMYH